MTGGAGAAQDGRGTDALARAAVVPSRYDIDVDTWSRVMQCIEGG